VISRYRNDKSYYLEKIVKMDIKGNTDYTPGIDDNLLGLTDKNLINLYEASGIAKAELLLHELDEDTKFEIGLILNIHRTAFAELYDWAGKWRSIEVQVGKLTPPTASKVPNLMYQYNCIIEKEKHEKSILKPYGLPIRAIYKY
jgi:fido (protein-threonine AMPylation protein)